MQNLFSLFNTNLRLRYHTLLESIKYESNAFYDSYNALFEAFLREVLTKELKMEGLRGSIHDLIAKDEARSFLITSLGISEAKISKALDYALKLNKHKHNQIHEISLELVIKYFKLLYDFIYAYSLYKGISIPLYNEAYLVKLYGSGKREVELLELEVLRLKAELKPENYESLIDDNFKSLDVKEQNELLLREVNRLKDLKLTSLEAKLNKSLEMLLNLNDLIKENKRISKGVANMIGGDLEYFMDSDEDGKES